MSAEPPVSPAQARLAELLELLRSDPPSPPEQLSANVMRRARFERGVRSTTRSVGGFGASLLEGIVVLFGLRRRGG